MYFQESNYFNLKPYSIFREKQQPIRNSNTAVTINIRETFIYCVISAQIVYDMPRQSFASYLVYHSRSRGRLFRRVGLHCPRSQSLRNYTFYSAQTIN